jgi:hypothetical protein
MPAGHCRARARSPSGRDCGQGLPVEFCVAAHILPIHYEGVSVNAYIHADPTLKERALDRLTPLNPAAKPGRYKPADELLAFLESI